MDDRILDPDGASRRLAAWKGRIGKLAAATQAMSDQLSQARVTATDPAGLARVTVDSTGALVGLQLTDRIRGAAPAAVAQAVMTTLAAARRQMADRSRELITGTLGDGSPTGQAIAEAVGRQLRSTPVPAPETPPAEPKSERRRPKLPVPDDDDDGYDLRSYLRRD
ncbi:YbaB/EbfC family nucleoid-associated protein [Amycolatopsis sp. 195334CR]|uniref:YbaB/EbfC family nucleoid-associated protein n=1 Tax=Amycolatopsis sp. 195334CR TaxID=2814588 RepID=UPI001A9054D5|nr:YbaB/EbfC family nucleoid-associated protein [Amycolatopsis sp. 195334CR]MBN6039634.1 YbaB/EbfC family nucleoid-associated protein [Amycolatopsis sp. 195334CR]